MMNKNDLLSLEKHEIEELLGEPKYRTEQLLKWVYTGVYDFNAMRNLPAALRERLDREFYVKQLTTEQKLVSKIDGTVKYLFDIGGGNCIESVFMRYKHGNTVCISTQAGCRMGCAFCASTVKGLSRNLTPSEMLSQVISVERDTDERVSHIVLMGVGEPLDNYENTLKFLKIVNAEYGLNISYRNISLSTCGLVDKIEALSRERLPLTLSVSLHAPNDEIRNALMPINKKWNITELTSECRKYSETTGRRISFEYTLINGVNDAPEHARELSRLLKKMMCHVNLIPVNTVSEKKYAGSGKNIIYGFQKILQDNGITTTVRRKLGADINAACGQLRLTMKKAGIENAD